MVLGEEIARAYRAKVAEEDNNDDSAVIFGDLHSKLSGGRSTRETIVLDSGCSRDIITQSIVTDLGLEMKKLDKPLHIVSAEGNALDIIGTVTVFMSAQATGGKKKMIEAAVRASRQSEEPQAFQDDPSNLPQSDNR